MQHKLFRLKNSSSLITDYLVIVVSGTFIGLHKPLNAIKMNQGYIQVVVNPAAGSGKAKHVADTLFKRIKERTNSEIYIDFSRQKDDALLITRKAINNGAVMIVALGGDGTINEVVNGFFSNGEPINDSCELGIINCGTGGGFARTINIPRSITQQIDLLLSPGSLALDVGYVKCRNYSGETIRRLFVNECQIGIGSKVASAVGKKSKRLGGTIAFGMAAAVLALIADPVNISVCFDNEGFQKLCLIGLVVGIGTECAGGMKLTPDAILNDGFFDVLSIHNMNVRQRMLNLAKVYSGKHLFSPHFSIKKCKAIKIRSDIEISIEGDGEILGTSPFDIEILPSAIRVKTGYLKN
jgi:diacylglycerol kinase (ATP)